MILLMGIAGSGKGTQGKLLALKNNYTVISTGELIRNYGTSEQHQRMHEGKMLRDDEVTNLLNNALNDIDDQNEVILDGYPRRISQAKWLLEEHQSGFRFRISCVLHLQASADTVKRRLLDRARADDHDNGIEVRFREYQNDTAPILTFMQKAGIRVETINAEQTEEEVHAEILNVLAKQNI
jgi:adenylate kinase